MAKPKRVNMWQNKEYDHEKSTLNDKSNLNRVFRITTRNVKESAQAKLGWSNQILTNNMSNNLAQGTLSHNTRIQGKTNSNKYDRQKTQAKPGWTINDSKWWD